MQYDINQFVLGGAFYTTSGEGVVPSPLPTVVVEIFDIAAGTSSQTAGVVTAGQVTGLYWCRFQLTASGSYNVGFRFVTSDSSVDGKEIVSADHNGVADNAVSDITITAIQASQIAAAAIPGQIEVVRGDSLAFAVGASLNFTGVTEAWFTVKPSKKMPDVRAEIQISESGGLLVIDGAVAVTSANGSMTQGSGVFDVVLTAVESAKLTARAYDYDLQMLRTGSIETSEIGTFTVLADVTKSIS